MRNILARVRRRIGISSLVVVTVCGVIAPLFASPALAAQVVRAGPPPRDTVTIDVVKVNGSGCRHGTAVVALSPDNTAFTVTYSEYLAQVGVGAKNTDFRKDCKLDLRVNVPKGFTYAVNQVDHRGFAHLESGASAVHRASYYFQGAAPPPVEHPFSGPFSDDWQATDLASPVFAPCGKKRHFIIDTDLRVDAGTSDPQTTTSLIAMDSTDGSVETTYHLAWRNCD